MRQRTSSYRRLPAAHDEKRRNGERRLTLEQRRLKGNAAHGADNTQGLIYFIQGEPDGPIKIGQTRDIRKRLRELQTASHEALRVVHAIPVHELNLVELEHRIHEHLAAFRVRGEWYLESPVLWRIVHATSIEEDE